MYVSKTLVIPGRAVVIVSGPNRSRNMFAHDRIGLATNVGRFAFAVALATLHSGDSIAQGQPRQITKTDIFGSGIKKSTTRKSAPGVPGVPDKRNRGELVAGPNIKSFTARRT